MAQQRLTRAEARTRARQRAVKGELVHLSSPSGSVRVQREGRTLGSSVLKHETVPPEGMTVHAGRGLGSLVSVQPGGSITITSKSRGRERVTAEEGPVEIFPFRGATKGETSKLLSLRASPTLSCQVEGTV